MTGILLNLRFKGERNYLHGTDLFNEAVTCAQAEFKGDELKDIDFSIRHMARSQVKMLMGPPPADVKLTGTCTFSTTQGRQHAYLVETGQPVAERYPFPEDELVRSKKIDQIARLGTLFKATSFTDAEVWVSMTKALRYKIFPELTGKMDFRSWPYLQLCTPNPGNDMGNCHFILFQQQVHAKSGPCIFLFFASLMLCVPLFWTTA